MKALSPALVVALAAASCASSPEVRFATAPDGSRVVSVLGSLQPEEVRAELLFASAEATLETGARYFRVLHAAQTAAASNHESGYADTGAYRGRREGTMTFATSRGPADGLDTYDALVIVISARPEVRSRLSDPARRNLEALKHPGGSS